MKKTLLILIGVLLTSTLWAQSRRLISGVIRDRDGSPLPGVNVIIKGTTNGVATDANGFYSLVVNVGDVIILSFVGFQNREFTVTDQNSVALDSSPDIVYEYEENAKYYDYSKIFKPRKPLKLRGKGVGVLTDLAPRYKSNTNLIQDIYKIKYHKPDSTNPTGYFLVKRPPARRERGRGDWKLRWLHTSSLDLMNRLPEIQNNYAQGRSANGVLLWQGPETGEIYSWGPVISSLNYNNNSAYAFDRNGSLSPNSNGGTAQAYDPLSFFRAGFSTSNVLEVSKELPGYRQFYVQAKDQRTWSPIPFATSRSNLIRVNGRYDILRASLQYYNTGATLPNRGANWQNIMGSVLSTPPTFDQSNGLKRRNALSDNTSYIVGNGTARTPSPGLLDNPFGLVNQMPDQQQSSRLAGRANLNERINLDYFLFSDYTVYLEFDFDVNFDVGAESYLMGLAPTSSGASLGRMVQRDYKNRQLGLSLKSMINPAYWNEQIQLSITQNLSFDRQMVDRRNAFGFNSSSFGNLNLANQPEELSLNNFRRIYQLTPKLELKYRLDAWTLSLDLANQFYFSSTLSASKNTRLLPFFNFSLVHDNLFDWGVSMYTSANYIKTLRETPLVYNQWHYNTTNSSSATYQQYFERNELGLNSDISPETNSQWAFKFSLFFNNGSHFGITYQDKKTENHLLPLLTSLGDFAWANVAEVRNKGVILDFNIQIDFASDYYWKTYVNWFRYRPMVSQLYNNATSVPLAGYQDAGTRLVADQPYGVIYGSQYERSNGQLSIDNDGFPTLSSLEGVLGDPNPEWVLQWGNNVKLYRFQLDWVLSYRHGGQRWNGTQARLDYLGVSRQSADLRNTQGFIFQGINGQGEVNQIPVDFANPANGLSGNRWVRYGAGGVAEDYIQSASSLRFEEIKLSYQVGEFLGIWATKFTAAVFVKNLLLNTPYQGFDPNSTFLSYPNYQGLDLFNAPALTSWGVQFNISY